MAADPSGQARASFELKSTQLSVVAVALRSCNAAQLQADLAERLGSDPDFFNNDPVLIDLAAVREEPDPIDFAALVAQLRSYRTQPVAVRGGSASPGPDRRARATTRASGAPA